MRGHGQSGLIPGGAAAGAALGALAAAVAAAPLHAGGAGFARPRFINNNAHSTRVHAAELAAIPAGSYHRASLAMVGVIDDDDARASNSRLTRGTQRSQGVGLPSMAASMRSVHAKYFSGDALASRAHAVTVLYEGLVNDGNGMPDDEWELYVGAHTPGTGGARLLVEDDLVTAAEKAVGERPFPRSNVRIDFWISTREGDSNPVHGALRSIQRSHGRYVPPSARLNSTPTAVPRLIIGERRTAAGAAGLRAVVHNAVERFKQIIDEMESQDGSNRTLDRVICAQVWAVPTTSARVGGGTRLGFSNTDLVAASAAGEHSLTAELFASRGLVPNWPDKRDTMCIARSIMTALDEFLETTSDAHVLNMLGDAYMGADRLLNGRDPTASAAACAAWNRLEEIRALIASATATLTAQKRRIKVASDKPGPYRPLNRYRRIEGALELALSGRHPLVDFSRNRSFFETAQPLDEDTLATVRAAFRPESKLALQIWGISSRNKIGLVHADPRATLDFLMEGGRVLNILSAFQHASFVKDVGACCNRVPVGDTSRRGRYYCSLCGHSVSVGNPAYKLKMFDHQRAGCALGTRIVELSKPLTPGNRRQLSFHDFRALNRSLLLASIATTTTVEDGRIVEDPKKSAVFVIHARTPSKETPWVPYGLPVAGFSNYDHWAHLQGRWAPGTVADMSYVKTQFPALNSSDPWADVLQAGSMAELLDILAHKLNVDAILKQAHFACPKDSESRAACHSIPVDKRICYGCQLPCSEPSIFARQHASLASKAVQKEREDSCSEQSEDSDSEDDFVTEVGVAYDAETEPELPVVVEHHCHATGQVYWAHADCNTAMSQSSSTLVVEVASREAMVFIGAAVSKKSFIEDISGGKPPRISLREGVLRSIEVVFQGSPRPMTQRERAKIRRTARSHGDDSETRDTTTPLLTLRFRARESMLSPALPETAESCALEQCTDLLSELESWSEREFVRTGLFAPHFATRISYARATLHRQAARMLGAASCTSIVTKDSLENAKRIPVGGMLLLGERVEGQPLDPTLGRRVVRLHLDITAAHPTQLKRYALPAQEHADIQVHNFTHDLTAGRAYIQHATLDSNVERVEVSGAFPPETHENLSAVPPVWSRITYSPADLSRFQRLELSLHKSAPALTRTTGHFLPVDKIVVFMRTAKLWQRLGFVFSHVGPVYATPSSPWARSFAVEAEERRRACAAAGDTVGVEDVKSVCNSVIGSLAIDATRFTVLVPVKQYEEEDDSRMTRLQKLADNPRSTTRSYTLGDVTYVELEQQRLKHRQQTLAAKFVPAMTRDDLVELWYGDSDGNPGLRDVCKATLIYGNTDSILVEYALTPEQEAAGKTDARHEFFRIFHSRLDLSNVPSDSTFWTTMPDDLKELPEARNPTCNRGKWGFLKVEDAFGGIDAFIINGPNRYGYRRYQHPVDTPAEYRSSKTQDVLKSLPRVWKDLESPPTLEDVWKDWLHAPQAAADVPPLPPRHAFKDGILDELAEIPVRKLFVAPWCNVSCIVSRTAPYRQWPIGSAVPEARACVEGTAW